MRRVSFTGFRNPGSQEFQSSDFDEMGTSSDDDVNNGGVEPG